MSIIGMELTPWLHCARNARRHRRGSLSSFGGATHPGRWIHKKLDK